MYAPAPASAPKYTHDDSDPHFINYSKLYKSPLELNIKSEFLIDDYSNALISGQTNNSVYPDSPHLVGNRYFLNTGVECENNGNTHTRSILIDNVLDSSIKKTGESNTGLLYSFFASLRELNSDKLYPENTDTHSKPSCKKVNVYSNDKKQNTVSGWVVEKDMDEIDSRAIKEGFTSLNDVVNIPRSNLAVCFYILTMLLILCIILYRFIDRLFGLEMKLL